MGLVTGWVEDTTGADQGLEGAGLAVHASTISYPLSWARMAYTGLLRLCQLVQIRVAPLDMLEHYSE